jgi:hypothetical protein
MKRRLVKFLFLCLAIFLQVTIVSAQKTEQKKLPDYWKPKVKTEKIVGEIIAYDLLSCAIRIDICYLFTIFKLEEPIKDNRFIRLSIPYAWHKERKALTAKRQKMELNVVKISWDETFAEKDFKYWKMLKDAENESIPFGSSIPIYISMGEIKKIKD